MSRPKGYHKAIDALRNNEALEAEVERLKAALKTIASYGTEGVCPYGCDTPSIAQEALGKLEGGVNETTK